MKRIAFLCFLAGPALAESGYDCVVDPSEVVEIGSAADGIVEEILVGRGDIVAKGDVVARLESTAERASLVYATERARNRGAIEIAEARVEVLRKQADRVTKLSERGLVADDVLESALADLEIAELELRQARLDQRLAELDLDRVAAQIERRETRSPIDGIVITKMIGPGEYTYSQAPLAQIARIDPLHVEVFLPTELYTRYQEGQTVTVHLAEPIGGAYEAKILVIDKVLDAASDTFGVRLALPNREGKLPAGIDCTVDF